MILRELKLENFRMFSQTTINFSDSINIITGMNGQGKTSILESLYYSALTRSFRTNNDQQTIQYDKEYFNICTLYKKDTGDTSTVRVFYAPDKGKHIFFDEKQITRYSEYIGTVPCVLLTLNDLKLTLGSPVERRRFIDILLSQISPVYLDHLKKYRRTLMQRNALLSQIEKRNLRKELEIWDDKLVEHGSAIIKKRKELADFLNENLHRQYNKFIKEPEVINVRYICRIDVNEENIMNQFYDQLRNIRDLEKFRATTLIGPHRDDLAFFKGGKSFKDYGSQGENKTLVMALKLSEWEYHTISREIKPILLLDDIFSELDHYRIKALVNVLDGIGQSFITTTQENFPGRGKKYIVKNGQVGYG